eukprot:scaffold1811_cov411-Prasinococcus_capsulatus_cf.AAC.19
MWACEGSLYQGGGVCRRTRYLLLRRATRGASVRPAPRAGRQAGRQAAAAAASSSAAAAAAARRRGAEGRAATNACRAPRLRREPRPGPLPAPPGHTPTGPGDVAAAGGSSWEGRAGGPPAGRRGLGDMLAACSPRGGRRQAHVPVGGLPGEEPAGLRLEAFALDPCWGWRGVCECAPPQWLWSLALFLRSASRMGL